jgi:hypothetical protein
MVIINTAPAILQLATTPTLAPFPPPAVGLASSQGWPQALRWMLVGSGVTVTVLLIIAALTLIARRSAGRRHADGGGMPRGTTAARRAQPTHKEVPATVGGATAPYVHNPQG